MAIRYERDDFIHALDVGASSDEVSVAVANRRAISWSRATVASGKAEPELLLSLAVDEL